MTPKETLAARADMLAANLSKDQQKKIRSAYLSMKGNWKDVQDHLAVEGIPDEMLRHLELTHHLADITDNNATLVRSLQEEKVSSIHDLALNFDSTRLASLIKPEDLPKNISGETQEEKTRNYINSIENTLYRKAPSAVISRMVKNGDLPVKDAATRSAMLAFFEQQPDFDIRTTSVYAAENKNAATMRSLDPLERPQVTAELKSLQRVAVMSDTPDVLPKLMAANITSAHQVVKQSKDAFVKNYATQLGGETAAEMVYERAADINTRNEYALMALRDAVTGVPIAAISGRYTDGERQQALVQVAEQNNVQLNWEALFGNADFCECDECRSVYSPSAYFVELLQFLRNNNLDPEKSQVEDPKDISGTVLEKLFRRRPDLGNLQLTCENTNTILPYVDLVNEIMESFVVHLPEYQSDGSTHLDVFNVGEETSSELLAVPQHVNYDAYCRLKKAVYPFTLPFHQPVAAMRILLENLGTSRHELMHTFRSAVKAPGENEPVTPEIAALEQEALNRAVDAEFLQMTQEEYVILAREGFYPKAFFDAKCEKPVSEEDYSKAIGVKPIWEYYGYTNGEDMIARLKTVKKGLLQRTGISYKELVDLLNTHYINPAYPKGKTLTVLQQIPYSYRYLQSLVLTEATEPAVKYGQVIALLEPVFADPCEKTDIRKWVLKNFERIGRMVVLESGVQPENDYYYYYNMQTSVNGYGELSISEVADDCDINKVKIQHLDGTDLVVDEYDRIQRFIRLWRKTGWTIDEVDKAITGLGAYDLPCNPLPPQEDDCLDKYLDNEDCSCNGKQEADVPEKPETKGYDITPAFIHQLVAVKQLLASTNLPLVKLLAFWTEIDTYGNNSLYRKLFLTHNLKAIDPVFHADKYGNYLTKNAKISEHIPVLMAALQLKTTDIEAISTYTAMPDVLTLEHVSVFFRYGTLAKLLRQSIPELIEDIKLLGDPFNSGYDTLQFIQLFNNINTARFKPAQLNYIIRDVADPKANIAPSPKAVLTLAKTLYDGLRKIATDTPDVPDADISAELLRSKLELLFSKDIVTGILGLLDGSTTYSSLANAGLEISIPEELKGRVIYDKVKGLLSVTGILSAAQMSAVQALSTDKAFQGAIADIGTRPEVFFDDTLFAVFSNLAKAKQLILAPDSSAEVAREKIVYCYKQYLPFLRKKLGLQLIVQVLSGNLKLDAETTEVLLTEILTSQEGNDPLISDIEKVAAQQGNDGTSWKGYLSPSTDDKYTFIIRSESAVQLLIDNETIVLSPQANNAKLYESEPQRLKSGQLYKFQVSGINGDLSALSWKTPTIPKMQIPDSLLFPAVASEAFGISYRRLHKTALVINGFRLTIEELEHFHKYRSDFSDIDFNALNLEQWRRLFDYTQLRGSFTQTETSLPEFFTWAQQPNGVMPAEKIASLTGWVQTDIEKLITPAHYNFTIADLVNEKALVKLQQALKVSGLIGMDIDKLFEWAKPSSKFNVTHQIAESIRSAMQSRYSQSEWEQVVKPLNDNLRNQQKKALISYLLVQPALQEWADDHAVALDADTLFEFFLIDVQMETSMETSRIKQAISSVQTYVQRCFLGLERDVTVDELDHGRWEWMQRYRVWEANRKVFLYPENWIQPELRDSKSPFFKELEAELLQKDITMDNVQTALMNYLQKLEEVSRLDTCAIYQEYMDDKKTPKKMHVFSRTRNAPYIYYHRHFDNIANTWSPWDKIQTDIQQLEDDREVVADNNRPDGVCLIPAVWNNRLLLFWPVVSKKQQVNSGNNDKNFHQLAETKFSAMKNREYREIKLAWSEYKNGKWTTRQTSSSIIKSAPAAEATALPNIFFVQNVQEDYIKINAYDVSNGSGIGAFLFKFGNIISAAAADGYNPAQHRPAQAGTQYMNYYWNNVNALDLTDDGSATGLLFDHPLQDIKVVRPLQQEYNNATNTTYPLVYQEEFSGDEKNGRVFVGIERPLSYDPGKKYLEIEVFHHPYVGQFIQRLNRDGVPGLLSYLTQSDNKFVFQYWQEYNPKNATYVGGNNYGVMDFGEGSWRDFNEERLPYAVYNWELFFHIPLLIANQLSKSQRFEEAMQWFHYIFNPMSKGPEDDVRRYWQFVPFKTDVPETLMAIFNSLQPNTPDQNISNWRDRPFNPHLVARSRPTAYMKTVVMKYLDNLIAWGDQLYRQNTLETINQATMLYVMAGHILGPRPQLIPKRGNVGAETYNNLLGKWDAFSNAMVEMELIFPFSNQVITGERNGTGTPYPGNNIYGFAASLYFGIPNNPNLLGYWDTVGDRLFKIRNSMNIDGIVQKLPLFEPPIDPGLLVQAAAMGLSLSSVLSDLNAPMPYYRFQHLIQKALELCNEVKVLGGTLLSVFEKKDAESLARIRATHESNILNLMRSVKEKQLQEASAAVDTLLANRESSSKRLQHYQQLLGVPVEVPAINAGFKDIDEMLRNVLDDSGMKLIDLEKEDMDKAGSAADWQTAAGVLETAAGIANFFPSMGGHGTPLGVGVAITFGGQHVGAALAAAARGVQTVSNRMSYESSNASKKNGFLRQRQDWIMQANAAGRELMQIDKQVTAANIRIAIATKELENQDVQIEQAREMEDYLRNKYTNGDLYQWMEGQVKTVYHQAYQLAYDMAKKAEKTYRFERGEVNTSFIQFGYWDSSHDGLMAGEQLSLAIKQMERSYMDNNKREYEITKHISLAQLNPLALISLKETGIAEVVLPEELFDMDFPGHYMRRLKSVAVSIPCVAGPYTSVNATLTLLQDKTRIKSLAGNQYAEDSAAGDDRFVSNYISQQSIATSSGQSDSGMFELNFRDERYLPFEGAGAVSRWRLSLPAEFRQFDYDTISDVVLHVRYTAREGGGALKSAALDHLDTFLQGVEEENADSGLYRLFSLRHEFANEWYQFLHPVQGQPQQLKLSALADRLPFFTRSSKVKGKEVLGVELLLRGKSLSLQLNATDMQAGAAIGDIKRVILDNGFPALTDEWIFTVAGNTVITPADLQDAWLIVQYSLSI